MLTFNMSYFLGLFPRLSTALPFTMEVIAASILLCLCTGTLVAVIRIAKVPFLHQLCEVWLSYNRSMPFILDLYVVYFVLPVIVRGFSYQPRRLASDDLCTHCPWLPLYAGNIGNHPSRLSVRRPGAA